MKNKKKFERRLPKTALNVCEEIKPGVFMIYQLYADMKIPLLGRRVHGQFVELPSPTWQDAFRRLNTEYYE